MLRRYLQWVIYGAVLHAAVFVVAGVAHFELVVRILSEPYWSLFSAFPPARVTWYNDGIIMLLALSLTWGGALAGVALALRSRPVRREREPEPAAQAATESALMLRSQPMRREQATEPAA
jgi:hypothetical protein